MARTARGTHSDAPAWRTPAIIGGVVVLAVIAGVLFALMMSGNDGIVGAGPSPTPTSTPSAPASPSDEPSPSETPSEEPGPTDAPSAPASPTDEADSPYRDPVVANPEDILPPGGVVRVLVDGLRVRDHALLDSPERTVLGTGDLLVVGPTFGYRAFGPSESDGYVWYPVGVLGTDQLPEPGGEPIEFVETGWVAFTDGDSEWLEPIEARCTDDEPTLQHLSSLTEWERLACYGDQQLTFEGVLGCGGCGGMVPGTFTPEWLAFPMNMDFISVEPQEFIGPMALNWSPDGQARPDTSGGAPILRVTGHFDDPAASECSLTFGAESTQGGETQVDPAMAELFCRTNFVVESYEMLGVDEDFPSS